LLPEPPGQTQNKGEENNMNWIQKLKLRKIEKACDQLPWTRQTEQVTIQVKVKEPEP